MKEVLPSYSKSMKVEFVEPRGNVVRRCPGTKKHICCGLLTIDLIEGCPLFCSYCILRDYLNGEGIRVVKDISFVIDQIEKEIEGEKEHIPRFCTGELSDSLALDRALKINIPLLRFFGERKKAILELKSKWAYVDHLLPYLNRYVVISFSLAPQKIIDEEEKRTSSLKRRLLASKKLVERGFYVGFHFDPIVIYPGFEKDYYYVIEDISRMVDLKRVIWVSLGTLRFPPKMFERVLLEGRKNLLLGEFIRGEDGKYRYLKAERIRAYKLIYEMLKEKEETLFIYLCMERADVWKEITGEEMKDDSDLIRKFDSRIREFYGREI